MHDETELILPCTVAVADRVVYETEVDSTNAVARRMLAAGELFPGSAASTPPASPAERLPMAVIVADRQREGHGRLGRAWVGTPGESSMVSYVAPVPFALAGDPRVNGWLQMIAGLASAEAIAGTCAEAGCADCPVRLKWPNDIIMRDRKLGGILIELVVEPAPTAASMAGMVFGVGINLGIPADRLPTPAATSLQLHCAPLPDPATLRDRIAARTVTALRSRLRALIGDPARYAGALRDETAAMCWTLGRQVEARLADGTVVRGEAVALNPDASLTVRDASGLDHVVTTGDVGVL